MGLRPTQGDEKTAPVQQLLSLEAPALPFVISTGAHPDFLLRAAATTTYAVFLKKPHDVNQRHESRQEIWGAQWRDLRFSGPLVEIIFDRGIMGLRPTQGDEKRVLLSNYCPWKHCPPLCHLDRLPQGRLRMPQDASPGRIVSSRVKSSTP